MTAAPMSDEMLVQLVDAAGHGPSGSNAQNRSFVIVRDPEQERRVQAVWKKAWGFSRDTIADAELRPHEAPRRGRSACPGR